MLIYNRGIPGWDGYLRCQGQTITKPAIGGPGPPRGLALPPELLSTIHLSIINHSDPLREGCKIEKCFRMSNIVYPGKSYWKAHVWFQARLKPVKYKNRCVHKYGVRKVQSKPFLCSFHIYRSHFWSSWKMKMKTYTHACALTLGNQQKRD